LDLRNFSAAVRRFIGEQRHLHVDDGLGGLERVRATSEGVGAVSPELALLDPPLAAEVRLTPDAVIVADADPRA
jgi:hypothetical protein